MRRAALAPIVLLTLACPEDKGDGATDGASAAGSSATGASTTDVTAGSDASGSSTGTGASTGVPAEGFGGFEIRWVVAACPEGAECDSAVGLQTNGLLRVETFDEPGATEVEVSAEDRAAAEAVFTDPALLALLDAEELSCDGLSIIDESMRVALDGATHEAVTVFCEQPPIAAARAMAVSLRDAYIP